MSGMRAFKGRRVLAITAGLLSGAAAHAAVLSWANAAGGPASTASNWSPVQVPTATDDLTFNLGANYAVTFNSTTSASRTQTYRQGTVTLTMTSLHTTSNGVAIGDLSGDVSTVTLATGTWSSGSAGFVNVGDAAGSTGTFNINDDDAAFNVTGTSDLFVGNNGLGTMNITGGGRVICNDLMHVGQGSAATGNLTVSGFVAQAPFPISTLQVNGAGQSRWGNGGDATVNVSNGAQARFFGDLVIANLSTSVATVNIQGGGLVFGATLDVDGDLLVGRNTSAGTAAGAATLNSNAASRVLVGGTMFLGGDPDGGTATFHTSADSFVQATSLEIGNGTTLDLDGGEIDVTGGALSWTNTSSSPRFNGGVDNPILTLRLDATATLSPTAGGPALVVGGGAGANLCDFDVRSGSDLATTGSVTLGEGSDDFGGMIVNGAGSTLTMPTSSTLTVGNAGDGRFEAELEGTVTGGKLAIASAATSTGFALIENPGTTATFNEVYVGGNISGAGGDGQLTVNAQAVLNVTSPGSIIVYAPGSLEVAQNAVINAANVNPIVNGLVELENGAVMNTGLIQFTSGAILRGPNDLAGAATLNGRTRLLSGATLELVNGDLTVGNASTIEGFDARDGSLVIVGPNTLTLHDQNRALFDDVTINGGHIIAPNGIEIVTPGQDGRMDGTGTITGQVFMESGGSVITSTGPNGITINGQFRNNSGNIDGTKYTFNNNPDVPDCGWTGAGAINARVVFNSGTKVQALANMTMGLNVFDGVTFNLGSELHADTRIINLIDSNGVGLPSVTDLNGGHIVCAQPLTVNNGRRLSGRGGSIDAPSVTVHGRLSPGELVGEVAGETGELTINGNLTLGVNSATDIEIAGLLGPIQYDRVVVNGIATLDGDLNISIIDGFDPPFGSVWTIMDYDSKVGDFANITVTGPSCVFVAVSDRAIVVSRGLPGDLDDDGDVDINDLALLLSNFGCRGGVEFPCPIDLDLNGDTDITDLAILLSNFGQSCN
ncbi:MAG: hypothetical protein AMXMBFR47_01450 [Planctomycetota bacterium]